MADDEYVTTLSKATLEKAEKELNEDPKNRKGAVETFRKWIEEQPHLKANTSFRNLLMFLRGAKFSQLRAREILEWNLKGRLLVPEWVTNLSVTEEILDFIKTTKYILPLPKRDGEGRQIVLCRAGGFDPSIHSKTLVLRANSVVGAWMLREEETQVNGLVYLMDLTDFGMKHQTFWALDDMRKMMTIFQKGTPGRFKGFNYYNMNPFFETAFQLFLPLLSKKFKQRICLHGSNLESVYKVIPMECMPTDYLPDDYKGPNAGSVQEIADNLVEAMRDPVFGADLEEGTSDKYYIDESKKPSSGDVPVASFRKLNVD